MKKTVLLSITTLFVLSVITACEKRKNPIHILYWFMQSNCIRLSDIATVLVLSVRFIKFYDKNLF